MPKLYDAAAVLVLAIHLAWILWVIFGAFWTRGHRWLTVFHLGSLVWGIIVEIGPWPCPLSLAEQFFELRAGKTPFHGSFLLHYLDRMVYPDLPVEWLIVGGVAICCINLMVYLRRILMQWKRSRFD